MSNRFLCLVGCVAFAIFLVGVSCAADQGGSPPSAPTGLTITPTDTTFSLKWVGSAGEKYNVYRSSDPSVTSGPNRVTVDHDRASNTINDSGAGLTPGKTYYWAVTAVNQNGESALSNIVKATTPAGPGAQPPGGQGSAQQSAPSTNVGTTSSSNVQNPNTDLYGITTVPVTLSTDSGSLRWSDADTETLINNVCVSQRPKTEPTVNMPSFGTPSTYAVINVIRLSVVLPAKTGHLS